MPILVILLLVWSTWATYDGVHAMRQTVRPSYTRSRDPLGLGRPR